MYLVTSEQMQLFDKQTIESRCVPGIVLMENAGREVALSVAAKRPCRVVVLCGKGNNGGDGWVVARWLKHLGVVHQLVISTVHPEGLASDAKIMYLAAVASGIRFVVSGEVKTLPDADIYVDALIGTGGKGMLRGDAARLAEMLNQRPRGFVMAVDVPSGVDASTGKVSGTVVQADETITFAFQKLGTAVTPGTYFAGRVRVVDIGIEAVGDNPLATWVNPESYRDIWGKRSVDAHKGTFGRLLVISGEMEGAAILAAQGGARIGAGLVAVGYLKELNRLIPWDFVVKHLTQTHLPPELNEYSALVLGPGLGSHAEYFAGIWSGYSGKGVLDADGLQLIPREFDCEPLGNWVLTPHPKECGRLLGWSTDEVQSNRIEAATRLAKSTSSIVVLKGYRALIAAPDGHLLVNPTGDASLAVAGTGDVLAGMIGGLLAQGLKPIDAAAFGVWLHGRAGELAGEQFTKVSTMASDVIDNISRAIKHYFDNGSGIHS